MQNTYIASTITYSGDGIASQVDESIRLERTLERRSARFRGKLQWLWFCCLDLLLLHYVDANVSYQSWNPSLVFCVKPVFSLCQVLWNIMKPWVKCSPERAGRGKYVKPFWFRSLRQSSGTGACLFFQIKIERNFYIDLYSLSFLQFSIRRAERLVSDSVSEIRVLSSVKVVCDIMEDEGASWLINRIAAHVQLTRIFHHLSPNYTVRTIVVYPKSTQVFCTFALFPTSLRGTIQRSILSAAVWPLLGSLQTKMAIEDTIG